MISRRVDPATVFVRGLGTTEGFEWGLWLALTVFWIVELDLTPTRLVLLGIVLEGAVILSETPTGVVADVYSRRRSLIIGQVVMGIAFVAAFATTNFAVVLLSQVLIGFGWTFRSGADTAWVSDEVGGAGPLAENELEMILIRRHRWGISLSLLIGPLTIAIGWWLSVQWAGIALGVSYTALAAMLAATMTEDHFTPGRARGDGFVTTLRNGIGTVRERPRLRILVVVILVFFLGVEVFDRLGYVHFLDNAGIDDLNESGESLVALGILFFILALGGIAVNKVAEHYLETGKGVVRLAVLLMGIAAVGGVIAAATSFVALIGVGYLLQDSVREALWPVMEGWANRDAPSEVRATVHSLMGQTTSVGQIGGAVVFGAVAEASSIPIAMAGGAICFAVAGFVATRGVAP